MPLITATDKPIYWAVEYAGVIVISSCNEIGGKTGIPPALTAYSDTDENLFLGKVVGKGSTYKPLPAAGSPLIAGEIYGYGGGLVIVRQSHTRTGDAPDTVPALFSVYRSGQTGALAWVANEAVLVGTQRTYGGKTYRCLSAHTTQVDWTPPTVPTLWGEVVTGTAWSGAGVAYKVNDIVTYLGHTYKCLQAHNSQAGWTPVAVKALWQFIS